MNIIPDKNPVNIEITLAKPSLERYSFYTPCFISENDTAQREVYVTNLTETLLAGYDKDSPAYVYCALAFAQKARVDGVVLISKRLNETYIEAYNKSKSSSYYYLSIDSKDVLEVKKLADYLLDKSQKKLIFYSNSNTITTNLKGYENVVWLWSSAFWFWDSGSIVSWDSDLDVEETLEQYPEAAWISRCGNVFPSQMQWLEKELVDVDPETGTFPNPSNYYTDVYEESVTWGSGCTCSGEWIDNKVFDDWLAYAIQRNIWKLFKSLPKVSGSLQGAEQLELKVKEVLDFAVKQQGIETYRISERKVNRAARKASFKFEYTRVHAIIGVYSVQGVVNV